MSGSEFRERGSDLYRKPSEDMSRGSAYGADRAPNLEGLSRMPDDEDTYQEKVYEYPHRLNLPLKSIYVSDAKKMERNLGKLGAAFLMGGDIMGMGTGAPAKKRPKSLRFSSETAPGVESDIAVSITRHRRAPQDDSYIEYTVVVHQKGYDVHALTKRFKQFETLNSSLKAENKSALLPPMPPKRYFKTNKWDDDYHMERRFALQTYLRLVIKLFTTKSVTLREFLDLKKEIVRFDERKVMSIADNAGGSAAAPQSGEDEKLKPSRPPLKVSATMLLAAEGKSDSGAALPAAQTIASQSQGTRPPLKVSAEMLSSASASALVRTHSTEGHQQSGTGASVGAGYVADADKVTQGDNILVSGKSVGSLGTRPPLKVDANMLLSSAMRPKEGTTSTSTSTSASPAASSFAPKAFSAADAAASLGEAADSSGVNGTAPGPEGFRLSASAPATSPSSSSSSIRISATKASAYDEGAAAGSPDYDEDAMLAMTSRLNQLAMDDAEEGTGRQSNSINSRALKVSVGEDGYLSRVDGLSTSPATRSLLAATGPGLRCGSFSRLDTKGMSLLSMMNESIGDGMGVDPWALESDDIDTSFRTSQEPATPTALPRPPPATLQQSPLSTSAGASVTQSPNTTTRSSLTTLLSATAAVNPPREP